MLKCKRAGKPVPILITNDYKDDKEKRIAQGHRFKSEPSYDQVKKRLAVFSTRMQNHEVNLKNKDENKAVALGTSKINYMDPRITVAWCKRNEVDISKIFSKTIRDKFPWACGVKSMAILKAASMMLV